MPSRGTGWSRFSSKTDDGLCVEIGAPKMSDKVALFASVGSHGIAGSDSTSARGDVGSGMGLVRSGIMPALPFVSRLVTTNPTVPGFRSDAGGGICVMAGVVVAGITPMGW